MTQPLTPDVLVVGGGPGGYVAAIRCGQLGLETVLVEAGKLGGTCLARGCIPSKALIHVAGKVSDMTAAARAARDGVRLSAPPEIDFPATIAWKDGIVERLNTGVAGLLKRANVTVLTGWGRFSDAKTCRVETEDGEIVVTPRHVILAAGSAPVPLPTLPFGGDVVSSTEALDLDAIPPRLVIVGAGYIGLELGGAFAKLGAEVAIVEAGSQILPSYDQGLVAPVKRALESRGVKFHLNAKAVEQAVGGLVVETAPGARETLPADKILVDERCATSSRNVWAIGDLVGEPMLAHKASAQGEMVAEIIAGHRRRFDPVAIPAICFTDPEIVSVGASPGAPDTIEGVFPFAASGRALTMDAGRDGGFVRVVADKETHRIIGVQVVGAHISELSAAFTHAIETGAVLEDVAGIIHAHPTLGEAFHEAVLKTLGDAIHV